MGRFITLFFIILGIISGIAVLSLRNPASLIAAPVPQQPATATTSDASAVSTVFNVTGTLVFYPNNIGPVPYIFYQDSNGTTVAKALTFSDGPPSDFSSWTGAHISVAGTLEKEHIVVSSITYLSGP
ncbi:MAG: hypothetical protein PHD04_03745 [Candidatus Pacebacteria bacterium]|nr:hypothetical protein [Candidatus Paceibacterota bacterium]